MKTILMLRITNFNISRFKSVYTLCIIVLLVGVSVAENELQLPRLLDDIDCNDDESLTLKENGCDFPDDWNNRGKGLRTAAVIGIVIGSLALASAFVILICFCFGCLCFKKHFYRRNRTEVLSATVRSNHNRSVHDRPANTYEVPSNNEAKIVIEPIPNPTFIDPGRNAEHQNIPQSNNYYNNRHPAVDSRPTAMTLPSVLYRRSSDDNSAYWGGYEDSLNGENIYSEPEYAIEASASPSYRTVYNESGEPQRDIAVIDGKLFHQGMNNHQPYSHERDNKGFVSSTEQIHSAHLHSQPKLTEL